MMPVTGAQLLWGYHKYSEPSGGVTPPPWYNILPRPRQGGVTGKQILCKFPCWFGGGYWIYWHTLAT